MGWIPSTHLYYNILHYLCILVCCILPKQCRLFFSLYTILTILDKGSCLYIYILAGIGVYCLCVCQTVHHVMAVPACISGMATDAVLQGIIGRGGIQCAQLVMSGQIRISSGNTPALGQNEHVDIGKRMCNAPVRKTVAVAPSCPADAVPCLQL